MHHRPPLSLRLLDVAPFLMAGGVLVLLAGLALDSWLHARTPALAAEEQLFTLTNPGHLLLGSGIGLAALGAVLFLACRAAQSQHPGGVVAAAALAGGIVVLGGASGLLALRASAGHHLAALATPAERQAAEDLLTRTRVGAARFADFSVAVAEGYRQVTPYPFGGGTVGPAHFVSPRYLDDGALLDPEHPESLVYFRLPNGQMVLLGVMFLAPRGQGPTPAGPLTSWHTHDHLCLGTGRVVPKIAGHCPPGTRAIAGEMMHLWLFDHPDGPFADHLTARALLAALRQLQERRLALP
ncbi:MAG: hypothetical protein KatS3mg061_0846 [Dehalococcoidia bacterium]|nr:MAG: hypothetical protein KatS3mg061_0846 [Dehalococcoidia bacterium]